MTRVAYAVLLILIGAALHAAAMQKPTPGGYVIEHEREVAKNEPGTHNGGGQTVGYSFFKKCRSWDWCFASARSSRVQASACTSRKRTRSTTSSAAPAR